MNIRGYQIISTRDLRKDANGEGILTLVRSDFGDLAHICNSVNDERSWHFLQMGPEIIFIGNWYRPGASDHDAYQELQEEMNKYMPDATGIILSGDLNIHHIKWLRFSNGNSQQGADLEAVCDQFGLQQLVN